MPRARFHRALWAATGLGALGLVGLLKLNHSEETVFEPPSRTVEPAPPCPWREPEADVPRFFPGATRWQSETRILSGLRVELTGRLGRPPAAEELLLQFHRVFRDATEVGTVLTRRVPGEHGSIELVLAVDSAGAVRGLRLQRWREPEPIRAALTNASWLRAFVGKRAGDACRPGVDLPAVPAAAQASAAAVAEGVRSLLILRDCAEHAQRGVAPVHHAP